MSKAFNESQQALAEMKVHKSSFPSFSPGVIAQRILNESDAAFTVRDDGSLVQDEATRFFHKSPVWQTLQSMTLLDHSILASYENIFEDILNVLDPARKERMLSSMRRLGAKPQEKQGSRWPSKPDGTGLIWATTMAEALKSKLITLDEAHELDRRRCWDKSPFQIVDIVRELEADLELFEGLNRRLGEKCGEAI